MTERLVDGLLRQIIALLFYKSGGRIICMIPWGDA